MPKSGKYEPFWGEPDASFDFCETNYDHIPFICEPFNAISNIFYVIVGAMGLFFAWRICKRIGLGFIPAAFIFQNGIIIVIGIGSFLFHSTLRRTFQLCDEIPMVLGAIIIFYSLIEIKYMRFLVIGNRHYIPKIAIILSSIGIISGYIFLPYWVFIVLFSFVSFFVVLPLQIFLYALSDFGWKAKAVFYASWAFGILGFIIWLFDHYFCDYVEFFKLHVFWHFCTATFCFYQVILGQYLWFNAYEVTKERPTFSYRLDLRLYVFPVIVVCEFCGP